MMDRRTFPDDLPKEPSNGGDGHEVVALPLARRPDFPLGVAIVRPSLRTVEGAGGRIEAEPRVMQVLLAFADADGAVLTREDLLRICWNGQVVGDDSINRAIAEVRRVAREAEAGFVIETIPRIGYRLKVEADEFPPLPPSGQAAASLDTGSTGTNRRWVLAGGGTALFTGGLAFWATRPPPLDPEAAQLMAEAQVALRLGRPKSDSQAIALLERAVARSPDMSAAWGLLALTRARTDEHALSKTSSPAAEVDRAANRALQLDRGNADAMAALAIAIPYYGDWLAAERRFDAVLAQHPGHLATQDSRSFFFGAVGRMRESAQERMALADEASLDVGMQFKRIYALWFLNRIEEADRVAARGMEMWPRHPGMWFGRLWVLADTGRFDRALAQIDDASARPPLPPPMVATLRAAIVAARSKQPADIDAAGERIMAGVGRSVSAVINAMMLLNLIGATDRAFELARAYYLEEGPVLAAMSWRPGQPVVPDQRRRKTNMLFTPMAARMQRDPRFLPLMQRIGLADYWYRRGVPPDFLARARA